MSTHFPEEIQTPKDEILSEVWGARAALLRKHGGLHGLVEFLRQEDDAETARTVRSADAVRATENASRDS